MKKGLLILCLLLGAFGLAHAPIIRMVEGSSKNTANAVESQSIKSHVVEGFL